ncbi:MAG TPA: flagellar export chaperone FlgN, partial [Archangium sp.]
TEVGRSQESRAVLKTLDTPALLAQASLREAFNQHSAYLTRELAQHLGAFAKAHGRDDVSLDELKRIAPFEGEQLAGIFAELRALSQALAELDAVNQQLAEKALTVVKAYVTHLAPRPSAYNRRGQPAVVESGTHSERA